MGTEYKNTYRRGNVNQRRELANSKSEAEILAPLASRTVRKQMSAISIT